jgi:pimeloyl-ACP methyl ester carboxylesterase
VKVKPLGLTDGVANVRGVELNYVEKGTGTPLVLVHGSLNDYRAWDSQVGPFAARYRVVAYSRRNHFPNEWSEYPAGYSVREERDDLVGLVEALGLKAPVHIVGSSYSSYSSYGAYIAALIERDYPEIVRSAVLGSRQYSRCWRTTRQASDPIPLLRLGSPKWC